MKLRVFIIVFLFSFVSHLRAQKEVTKQAVIWSSFSQKLKYDQKWFSLLNLQHRAFVEKSKTRQIIINTATYLKNNDVTFGVGFIYFGFSRNISSEKIHVTTPEWRPYQSITISNTKERWKFNTRITVEERFQRVIEENQVINDYFFTFRFRFKWEVIYTLWQGEKNNSLHFWISTEPMLNAGKTIVYNTFDQNRLVTLISFEPNAKWSFNTGYMNWVFQNSAGASFDVRHVWLIGASHTIQLKDHKRENCYPGMECY